MEENETSDLGNNHPKSNKAPEKLTKMQYMEIFCFHPFGHQPKLLPRIWKLEYRTQSLLTMSSLTRFPKEDKPADMNGELEDAATEYSSVLLLVSGNRCFSSMYKLPWRWHHTISVLEIKTHREQVFWSLRSLPGVESYHQLASFHLQVQAHRFQVPICSPRLAAAEMSSCKMNFLEKANMDRMKTPHSITTTSGYSCFQS